MAFNCKGDSAHGFDSVLFGAKILNDGPGRYLAFNLLVISSVTRVIWEPVSRRAFVQMVHLPASSHDHMVVSL